MKPKLIATVLWMVIFAAATFVIGPIALAGIIYSHKISDRIIEHVLWTWRFLLILSPIAGLFFGLRGALPGTKRLDATARGASATPKILAVIVVIILGLFSLGVWIAFQPPPGRPNVSIGFLGYTNDASGVRVARITVTNLNPSPVFAYEATIQIPAPSKPAGLAYYHKHGNSRWHSVLSSGTSKDFTIPVPADQISWRLSLLVYPDFGTSQLIIKRVVGISCLCVGLVPHFMRLPYQIEGDWIEQQNETAKRTAAQLRDAIPPDH